ncbi:MAG: MarR family winged helix-turn-helix transcriptional regulator [Gaiellaceae bacterium]
MTPDEKNRPSKAQYRHAAELRGALRSFLRQTAKISRAHGLTPERYELLLAIKIESEQNGGATVTGLCQPLLLSQSAVTQLVRRAENLGLLRRELSPRDSRIRYLRLTPEGQHRLAGTVTALGPERARLAATLGRRLLRASKAQPA